jgi:hypothetical protein
MFSDSIVESNAGVCLSCTAESLEVGDQLDSHDGNVHVIERIDVNSAGQTLAWIRRGPSDVYSCVFGADQNVLVVL